MRLTNSSKKKGKRADLPVKPDKNEGPDNTIIILGMEFDSEP